LEKLSDNHADAGKYLEQYRSTWEAARSLSEENGLVTWPDFPLCYINRYDWAAECAPSLYFLFYRSPAAFNRPVVHEYLAPPLTTDLVGENLEAFLRTNNNAVIKANHVVHHGSIGHHVQNWNAYHQTNSLIGQFAGCDCANRPAMISSGTMIEGWAVYATRLMEERGFFTKLESYAEVQSLRRMAARAVVDIRLHCDGWSLDEAAAYYHKAAGMNSEAAKGEAVKNSMFPGNAIIYLYGSNFIYDFREKVKAHQGGSFSIQRFHDDLLSYGSVPVSLVKAELECKYGMNTYA